MRYSPSCNCCAGGGGGCCSGTIPSTMTIQIVMVGSTNFKAAEAIFGSPPGVNCLYPCIDLQGTWVLSRVASDLCVWCAETTIARVVGSCTDTGFETVTVGFYLYYSLDFDSVRRLRLKIVRSGCTGGEYYEILCYAVGVPASSVCSTWTVAETLTPTASFEINGYGYCDADFDSVTASTP